MTCITVTNLKNRSERREGSACWHWLGATAKDGTPRIYTVDYDRAEKRPMSGPKAVFFIAQRCPLNGRLAYRSCFTAGCVNPDHIRTAATKGEIGRAVIAAGSRKGTHTEQRRANIAYAHQASGCLPTPRAVVLAIREAPKSVTGRQLAELHNISHQTVSRIRRNESHREVFA